MLRRMPEPCALPTATCHSLPSVRLTKPRWYSVRPGFLRIALELAARSSGSGSGVAPPIASKASRTKA